ncbi:MAG: hypothetical protein JWN70_3195 [Planctomycetaceae bacterium]|nr:hypothetical protein [Planctomycetaceae bacterium]
MSTETAGMATTTWGQISSAMSRGIFNLAYGVGFGVTFPVVFVAKIIPQENCIVWGLIDGAQIAYETANRDQKKS